jgi:transcriptional regulator with XRE-family HTH domain
MREDDAFQGVIAERLNQLFATYRPLDRPYTLKEVADGSGVSVQYLSQLRNGDRTDPSHSKLSAIARFFGVPVGYFSDDATFRRTDEELQALALMRDSGIRDLALRAAGLSEHSLALVTALAEKARRLEGLPDDPPADGDVAEAPPHES